MNGLFQSVIETEMTAKAFLICLAASLLCGLIIAISASFKNQTTKSFIISLVVLPMIVFTVITTVNGNIGTGVAVMGAFSLVRFRSVPGKAKDIAAIFLAMTSGLACSGGYIATALLFTVIVCVVLCVLSIIPLGNDKSMDLQITIPESLHFANEFEDIFNKYTKKHKLIRAKTSNMGSLYKLFYRIELIDTNKIQEFIDELRCRNGNLEISLAETTEGIEEL
ncbi:MAG: DUF4956 domain-containing protein [Clostridia bacterium]|nr:DUF4956 domain-containing protein [Clostridia bacterium]